jgi:hypothetical protein
MSTPLRRPRSRVAFTALAALLVLGACTSGSAATPSSTATASSTPAGSVAPASSSAADPSSATAVGKVSANTASQAEIAAALAAAGVPNADRWAREVTEYRPYPANDPTLQVLQDNLAKYNPDPATLAGILSALQP